MLKYKNYIKDIHHSNLQEVLSKMARNKKNLNSSSSSSEKSKSKPIQKRLQKSQSLSSQSKNSQIERSGRHKPTENQLIHIKRGQVQWRALYLYFQALVKCLFSLYYTICDESNQNNANNPKNSKQIKPEEIEVFVQHKRVFLQIFSLYQNNYHPLLKDEIKNGFKIKYLDEIPSKTFSFALQEFRKARKFTNSKQKCWITQIQIRCMYILSIFLVGVDLRKIDFIYTQCQNEKDISNEFNRIVLILLNQTKLLNKGVLKYISEYWDSVMQIYFQQQIKCSQDDTLPQEVQENVSHQQIKSSNRIHQIKLVDNNFQLKRMQAQRLDLMSEERRFYAEKQDIYNCRFMDDSNDGCQFYEEFENPLNDIMMDMEISSNQPSKNTSEIKTIMAPQQPVNLTLEKFEKEVVIEKNISIKEKLLKRAIQFFNYNKIKTQNQNQRKKQSKKRKTNIASQRMEQQRQQSQSSDIYEDSFSNTKLSNKENNRNESNSMSLESAGMMQNNKKTRNVDHELREIDALIKMLLEDEFVIAFSMANHISHALTDINCAIEGKQLFQDY